MVLEHLALGFFVKIVTGLDDTITHIPIIASVTKTKTGRIFFSIGTLVAVSLAIIIAIFFSTIIESYAVLKYLMVILLLLLAGAIYFDFFVHKPRTKVESKYFVQKKVCSEERYLKLFGIGFIASFATVFDDIIAFTPVLINGLVNKYLVISGILIATLLEVTLVIYFSQYIKKIKYKEELASFGLVILAILIVTNII